MLSEQSPMTWTYLVDCLQNLSILKNRKPELAKVYFLVALKNGRILDH